MQRYVITTVLLIGMAVSVLGETPGRAGEIREVEKVIADHPRLGDLQQAGPAQPSERQPAEALEAKRLPAGLSVPQVRSDYFCDMEDYTGVATYYWTIPNAQGQDLYNMRFTSEWGYACTLKAAHFLMYDYVTAGTPGMKVYLWDDDGFGFPGNKLDSVVFGYAEIEAAATGVLFWLAADFSSAEWVFTDGVEYHLGWTMVGDGNDTLAVISDDGNGPWAGDERASQQRGGVWETVLSDWGADAAFFILAERCCGELGFSDCYAQNYATNATYYWRAPHPTWATDGEYAQRFDVGGPETLESVDIAIYDDGVESGDDDIIVRVYNDSAGLPNEVLQTVTVPAGTYVFYPALQTVPMPAGFVLTDDFHVSFASSGEFGTGWESCLSSDGLDGSMRSSIHIQPGTEPGWGYVVDLWGVDVQFLFRANLCQDEYFDCSINSCYESVNYYWQLPDRYGDYGQAQRFYAAGEECRVDTVNILWYWNRTQYTWPRYTYSTEIKVWADAGGMPGAEVGSITVNPGEYGITAPTASASSMAWASYPLGFTVTGNYWLGVISNAPDTLHGISVLSDAGGGGCVDRYAEYWGDWGLMYEDWGFGSGYDDLAMVIEAEHCCIAWPPYCPPAVDWNTRDYNFARTGASNVSLGDAWCDLRVNWKHTTASPVAFAGPIVADRLNHPSYHEWQAVCSFSNEYKAFDLATGELTHTFVPQAGPFAPGDIRCTPTVANIIGYPNPVLFVSGGANDEILAYDFLNYTLIWSRHIGNVGPTGVFGDTRFGVFVVLDIGGQSVLYWTTDGGRLVAADALTGALYGGWATNPFNAGKPCHSSLATNGTLLFFGTQSSGVEGDVYAIDAATGALVWQLSASGGLQASTVYASTGGYAGTEGFTGGIAYDGMTNYLFTVSRAYSGNYPADGVFYCINAASGQLVRPASAGTQTIYSTPVVGAGAVFVGGSSRFLAAPHGGQIYAVNKFSGSRLWAANAGPWGYVTTPGLYNLDGCYNSPVLTCEGNGAPKQLYAFSSYGGFVSLNSETGEEIFRRRVSVGTNPVAQRGFGGALNVDGNGEPHLLFADNTGTLYDLKKGTDRPRLEIQDYRVSTPVEFGTAPSFVVTIPDVFANTGCAALMFGSVGVDVNSANNQHIPDFAGAGVPGEMMQKASSIADRLTATRLTGKVVYESWDQEELLIGGTDSERRDNYAAAGAPAWLNEVLLPAVGSMIPPGDTMDLVIDVNQALIKRGAQSFYLTPWTNDPDFFLNDPAKRPEIQVMVIGGCLSDTTTLSFGMGGANERLVSNTVRLGTGDWGDGPAGYNGFLIDGVGAGSAASPYFQGSYAFLGSKYQVATHTDDWSGGGTAMISMQPDPNWCDGTCEPCLYSSVTLGYMTHDGGITYDPMMGALVCASYVDSMQNFDYTGLGWDWTDFEAPFDDTLTLGLYTKRRTIGAYDIAELANVTLDIMEITERNGNPVEGWYLTHYFDNDFVDDTIQYNSDYSAGWCVSADRRSALGTIKIPFGCGYNPLVNIWGTYGTTTGTPPHGFWDWTQYWDTAYWYCTRGHGAFTEAVGMHGGDVETHITVDAHNWAGGDTYTVGVATFELYDITAGLDPYSPDVIALATMVNQWAGFGRGDVNNDGLINLADVIYLAGTVNGGPGAVPFQHLSDVNADGNIDVLDVDYLIAYYFECGPCPLGDWVF